MKGRMMGKSKAPQIVDINGKPLSSNETGIKSILVPLSGRLGQGLFAKVDKKHYHLVAPHLWHLNTVVRATTRLQYYRASHKFRNPTPPPQYNKILMGRYIMDCLYGIPKNHRVVHLNYDSLDCRTRNLRILSPSRANAHARRYSSKKTASYSVYRGVIGTGSLTRSWSAVISRDYEQIYLGSFYTEEEAAQAYDNKARELCGDLAILNFPD